jgi:hypothetical protein
MKVDTMFYLFIIVAMLCVTILTGIFVGEIGRNRCDINNDKVVNSEDILELRKYLLEIED